MSPPDQSLDAAPRPVAETGVKVVAMPARSGAGAAAAGAPPPLPPAVSPADTDAQAFAVDRLLHAWQGRLTGGLSPAALEQAFADWAIHLANAPGKQADLVRKWLRKQLRLARYAARAPFDPGTPPAIEPLPEDRRFVGEDWQRLPFSLTWQSFLMVQQWWHNATTGVRGVDPRHLAVVNFTTRQLLDAVSPANFPFLNPEVLRATLATGGLNLWHGWQNWAEDVERQLLGQRPAGAEKFLVGHEVAMTPGKVVFRNRLIELIQYAPATPQARPEPVVIIPAWIMKYYILDLSPHNSLVRYLVERGHTVFMVSWTNPAEAERDLGMEDYLNEGALAAMEAVRAIVPGRKLQAVGYCLGGTLLGIAAARLAAEQKDWLRTITLFAAQADFSEAGELMLFINESQVVYLEDMMWDQGYLDANQMSGAFQLLRSNDLIWSAMVRQYMLGERAPMIDLMAWNADQTRMPQRMHSEYLRRLFLDNDLAEGRYRVAGKPVSLTDVRAPIFAVSTTRDHIAPWRSVYKITWLTQSDVTFVLTTGGHNAGIVSEPGRKNRAYWIKTYVQDDSHLDAETWLQHATPHEGSWWPAWTNWLAAYSGEPVAPPAMGAPERGCPILADAPGTYVLAP